MRDVVFTISKGLIGVVAGLAPGVMSITVDDLLLQMKVIGAFFSMVCAILMALNLFTDFLKKRKELKR